MKLNYTPPKGDAPLYARYPRQSHPQPAYLELDPDLGIVQFGINGADPPYQIPMPVWNKTILHWPVSEAMSVKGCDALIADLMPLLERVAAGYSAKWDGRNYVGRLTADAANASEAIELFCREASETYDPLEIWDAGEWLIPDGDESTAAMLKITADTSDEELEAIAESCRAEAKGDGIVLDGDVSFELVALRARLREARS